MALTTNQRNAIQAWITAAEAKIAARQATYLANRGTYRQFKRSHVVHPQNATAVVPDNLADQPTNEGDGVTLAHANGGAGWPCSVTVDVYDGPQGAGYVTTYRARGSGGEVWSVARNTGPETWRAHGIQQEATL